MQRPNKNKKFNKISFKKKYIMKVRIQPQSQMSKVKYSRSFMSRSVNFMFCAFHKVNGKLN